MTHQFRQFVFSSSANFSPHQDLILFVSRSAFTVCRLSIVDAIYFDTDTIDVIKHNIVEHDVIIVVMVIAKITKIAWMVESAV